MAFPRASGYNNLPNGAFSPVIYSKKAQLAFRKQSVVQAITNSDYFGEINDQGDSVRIIKEPSIQVAAYRRGTQIQAQDLIDEDFLLVVDQANYAAFKIDDIEKAHAHHNWMAMATDQTGYKMKDQFDLDILGYMSGYKQSAIGLKAGTARVAADVPGTPALTSASTATELLASNVLKKGDFTNITTASAGDHSIPLAPRLNSEVALPTATASPAMLFNRAFRLLTVQNVPTDNRWAVVSPEFIELLGDEGSRFMSGDWGRDSNLRNGLYSENKIYGFRVYVSNNLPSIGTGPGTGGTANQNTNFGIVIFGHDSAVATAEQIKKTETFRDHDSFADVFRSLHLYGRKILRPEGLITAKYNVA